MSRGVAYSFGLGVVLLSLSPAFLNPQRGDSFPLSTYPMFAKTRERPLLYFAEGVDRAGNTERLAPALLGSGEVMQAVATVRRAVEAGGARQSELCRHIAGRLAKSAELDHVTRVRLVGARFDPIAYFLEGPTPLERKVHTECKVRRRSSP
jgi:hypothetical protein